MGDRVRQLIHVQATGPVFQMIRAVLALVVAARWRRPRVRRLAQVHPGVSVRAPRVPALVPPGGRRPLSGLIVEVLRPSLLGLAGRSRAVRAVRAAEVAGLGRHPHRALPLQGRPLRPLLALVPRVASADRARGHPVRCCHTQRQPEAVVAMLCLGYLSPRLPVLVRIVLRSRVRGGPRRTTGAFHAPRQFQPLRRGQPQA
jgi:hypothetical protein